MSKGSGDAHKKIRGSKHRREGKYKRQFIRTVKKIGRWRGKKKTVADLK